MTRSSIVAAIVVTVLLGLLIWWRDEHPHVARVTAALTPPSDAIPRTGRVTVVPAARSAPPSRASSSSGGALAAPLDGSADAGVPAAR
jgi:hypothetical protein